MSDSVKNITNPRELFYGSSIFLKGKTAKIALLAAFFAYINLASQAALFSNSSRSRNNSKPTEQESVQIRIDNNYQQKNLNGSNLDSYRFAQTHFGQSRSKLEQICRAISSRYNDSSARDILQKIYVIDTQLYMLNIKNSALGVGEILQANTAIKQGLQDLRQIIMSPGQQTLEALDKTIDKVRAINAKQLLNSQKYLACFESMISMSKASYETYEIIPSLNMTELDLFVQASKQLMTNIRSHSESFKGLILNVKSSSEQIDSGLKAIKQTIKETLRFSDHFAIKQFPLINLPTPSREKIFVQVNSLGNTVKGVENTASIGDSQVRNSSQQFTHLVSAFVDKSTESMRYTKADYSEKAQTQISNYARNQVFGLFARIKEDVATARSEMAQIGKLKGDLQPIINMESRSEYVERKVKSAAEEKLPLFLLGGKGNSTTSLASVEGTAPAKVTGINSDFNNGFSNSNNSFNSPQNFSSPYSAAKAQINNNFREYSEIEGVNGQSKVLFNENDFASVKGNDSSFMTSEMNILQQELGADFFFGDSGENISRSSLMASEDEDLPSFGVDEEYADSKSDSAEMQISYGNLEKENEPEVEMLRFDSTSLDEDNDYSIPMMRYDSDILNFDELKDEN